MFHLENCRTTFRTVALLILLFVMAARMTSAFAQEQRTVLSGKPGEQLILAHAQCIELPSNPLAGLEKIAGDSESSAVYTMPRDPINNKEIEIKTSNGTVQGGKCTGEVVTKKFSISTDLPPEVDSETLAKAFNILLGAFVIALLLESAFALLFNWRIFLEFFVGKAWRTPIMFLGALLIVRLFNMDLVSSLFAAFHPVRGAIPASSFLTQSLTAMILAGGSVGVNRILISLGFRSQIRADISLPPLSDSEAWIAINLINQSSHALHARIDVQELDPANPGMVEIPATIGLLNSRGLGHRIKAILFPSPSRFPRSGGRKVSTDLYYRIVVSDMTSGSMYDLSGKGIRNLSEATVYRFGSRAILDFDVVIVDNAVSG